MMFVDRCCYEYDCQDEAWTIQCCIYRCTVCSKIVICEHTSKQTACWYADRVCAETTTALESDLAAVDKQKHQVLLINRDMKMNSAANLTNNSIRMHECWSAEKSDSSMACGRYHSRNFCRSKSIMCSWLWWCEVVLWSDLWVYYKMQMCSSATYDNRIIMQQNRKVVAGQTNQLDLRTETCSKNDLQTDYAKK